MLFGVLIVPTEGNSRSFPGREDRIEQVIRLTTAGEGMWMIDTERGRI